MQNISAYGKDGRPLLSGAALTVLPGERVRVVTERPRFEALARIAGGLTEPEAGQVVLNGRIGCMPPDPGFWEDMTVLDNTALPLMAAGVSRRERKAPALDVLDSLGIGYAAHTYPKSLGLCERRLAALARALVTGPALVILTDPASMLDEMETARFANALSARWQADRFAALYCTPSGCEIIAADKTIKI